MSGTAPLLDAHEAPPLALKELYKRYQRLKFEDLDLDPEVLDFNKDHLGDDVEVSKPIKSSYLESIFSRFVEADDSKLSIQEDSPVYIHKRLPGRNLPFCTFFLKSYKFLFRATSSQISLGLRDSLNLMAGRSPDTTSTITNIRAGKVTFTYTSS
jgi:hypothetical protein